LGADVSLFVLSARMPSVGNHGYGCGGRLRAAALMRTGRWIHHSTRQTGIREIISSGAAFDRFADVRATWPPQIWP